MERFKKKKRADVIYGQPINRKFGPPLRNIPPFKVLIKDTAFVSCNGWAKKI